MKEKPIISSGPETQISPDSGGSAGMNTFTTTLNKIRDHGPCQDGWGQLLKHLGKTKADDEPLSLLTILNSNGLDDALWCCRAVDGHDKDFRLFVVWCARQVQHRMTDECSLHALDVAERHAKGLASDEELVTAGAAAWVAKGDTTWRVAAEAVGNVARGATRGIARAAWYAAGDAAGDAAEGTTWYAAWTTARAKQEARFRQMLAEGTFIGSTQPEARP